MTGQSWERLEDESSPAFAAFKSYRDMGLTRSTAKVGRKWGKNASLIDRWSSRHSWVVRAQAYDRELDRDWILEVRERRRAAARRNIDMADVAMDLVAKGLQSLETAELTVLDIVRLIEAFSKLERWALGTPTSAGQLPESQDLVFTEEDRIDRLRRIRDSIDERLAPHRDVLNPDHLPRHDRPDLRIVG